MRLLSRRMRSAHPVHPVLLPAFTCQSKWNYSMKTVHLELTDRAALLALMVTSKDIASRRDIAEFRKRLRGKQKAPPGNRALRSNWGGNKYT